MQLINQVAQRAGESLTYNPLQGKVNEFMDRYVQNPQGEILPEAMWKSEEGKQAFREDMIQSMMGATTSPTAVRGFVPMADNPNRLIKKKRFVPEPITPKDIKVNEMYGGESTIPRSEVKQAQYLRDPKTGQFRGSKSAQGGLYDVKGRVLQHTTSKDAKQAILQEGFDLKQFGKTSKEWGQNYKKDPIGISFTETKAPLDEAIADWKGKGTTTAVYSVPDFKKPLVIQDYVGDKNWKDVLHQKYGTGESGRRLTTKLLNEGYDSIITKGSDGGMREVIALKPGAVKNFASFEEALNVTQQPSVKGGLYDVNIKKIGKSGDMDTFGIFKGNKKVGEIDAMVGTKDKNMLWVQNIDVDEAMQRQGIGTKALDELQAKLGTNYVRTSPTTIEGSEFFKKYSKRDIIINRDISSAGKAFQQRPLSVEPFGKPQGMTSKNVAQQPLRDIIKQIKP